MASTQGKRIANAVVDFVNRRIDVLFTVSELRDYVRTVAGDTAPASADRIMRQLRQAGAINYVLVNRNRSEYKGASILDLGVTSGRTRSDVPNGCGGEVA